MFELQENTATGLERLFESTRRYADSFPLKLAAMQEEYFLRYVDAFDVMHRKKLKYYLQSMVDDIICSRKNIQKKYREN